MKHSNEPDNLIALMVIVVVVGLLGLSLLVNPVHAGDWCDGDARVIAGGWSHHTGGAENETHNAAGLQCNGWSAFAFKNSNGDDAVAVGREWMPWSRGSLSWGGYGGAWFGYFPDDPAAFIPVLAGRARWQPTERLGLVVSTVGVVTTLHLEWVL